MKSERTTTVDESTITVAGACDLSLLRPFVERHDVDGFLRNSRGGEVVFSLGTDDGEHIEFEASIVVMNPALVDAVERELRLILNIKD